MSNVRYRTVAITPLGHTFTHNESIENTCELICKIKKRRPVSALSAVRICHHDLGYRMQEQTLVNGEWFNTEHSSEY